MVKTLSVLGEELAHRGVGSGRLDELDLRLADAEHRGHDALLLDDLLLGRLYAEVLGVEAGGGVDILYRVTEVVDPAEQLSPFVGGTKIVEQAPAPDRGLESNAKQTGDDHAAEYYE